VLNIHLVKVSFSLAVSQNLCTLSTEGKIPASGGLQQRSQTAKEYAKVLGLNPARC